MAILDRIGAVLATPLGRYVGAVVLFIFLMLTIPTALRSYLRLVKIVGDSLIVIFGGAQ